LPNGQKGRASKNETKRPALCARGGKMGSLGKQNNAVEFGQRKRRSWRLGERKLAGSRKKKGKRKTRRWWKKPGGMTALGFQSDRGGGGGEKKKKKSPGRKPERGRSQNRQRKKVRFQKQGGAANPLVLGQWDIQWWWWQNGELGQHRHQNKRRTKRGKAGSMVPEQGGKEKFAQKIQRVLL